ncbi:gliding motility-associated C-terminal domain-containing protein [Ancylomarina longa]|uniref:Gliding motility-associated C-terminal domain-containing protein n=1 Tax=Ancylomarina longa TaxID=2487017 RepID=A0A434AW59_9BACT|nr:gliding motility-associated C-terminal domain-containing protein [Ancylomarina longa]RUT78722.1 gliding motility-associated C-terminal domain-containing protein [Ancylomarina longa]
MKHFYNLLSVILFCISLVFLNNAVFANNALSFEMQSLKAAPDNSISVSVDADTICAGETTYIRLGNSEIGVDYQVRTGTTNIGSTVSGTGNPISFSISPTATNTYNILATSTSTSETSTLSNTVSITVNAGPDLNLNVSASNSIICKGEGIIISVENSENGFDYLLNNGPDDFPPPIPGDGNSISFPQISPPSNTTYQVFVSSANCFGRLKLNQTSEISVSASPKTDLVIDASETNICPGETVILSIASSEFGVDYQVFNGSSYIGNAVSGNGSTIQFTLNPTTSELYTIRVFGQNCLSYFDLDQKILVTVNAAPRTDIAINSDKDQICLGESVTIGLDESETGINYQLTDGTNPIGASISGDGNAIFFPALNPTNTTNYHVKAITSACSVPKELSASKEITVIPQADPDLIITPNNASSCSGEQVSIIIESSEADVSYQLTDGTNNIGSALNGTGSNIEFDVNPTNTITYEINATKNTCSSTIVMNTKPNVTVVPLPELNINLSATPAEICEGDNTIIGLENSEANVDYQLKDASGTIGAPINGTGSAVTFPAITPSSSTTYYVDANKAACSSSYQINNQVDITVRPKPAASISFTVSPDEICEGEVIVVNILNSELGITYEVVGSTDGLLGSDIGTGADMSIFIKPKNNQVLQIQASSAGCSSPVLYPNTSNITVHPGPNLDLNVIADSNPICESLNTPVSITVENSEIGLTYWLKDDLGVEQSSATGNGGNMNFASLSPTKTTNYTVETTMPVCNDRLDLKNTIELKVIPLPIDTINLSISEPKICVGEKTIISMDTTEIGVSYQLYDGTYLEGNPIAGTGNTLSFPEFSPFRSVDYKVIATSDACGTSDTLQKSIYVTVGLQPEEHLHPTIDKHTICEGEAVTVSLTPTDPGVSYQLFDGTATIGDPLNGNSESLHFAPTNPNVSTTYRIEAMGENCLSPIDIRYTVDVAVHHSPSTDKKLIADQDTICAGEELVFSVENSEPDIFYQLFDGTNYIEPPIVGNGSTIDFPVQKPATNSTYQVFTHESVCTDELPLDENKSITVLNFDPLPLESLSTPDEICAGESIDIELPTSLSGVNYILKDTDQEINSKTGDGNSLLFEDVYPNQNSNLYIAIGNCKEDLEVSRPDYTIHPNPVIQIIPTDISTGYDGQLAIAVSGGSAPFTYIIDPGETTTSNEPVLELRNLKAGTYQVLVVDGNACRSSDAGELAEIKIDSEKQVILNNALTPNGDGINDNWQLLYNPTLGYPEVYIFNIYGQEVYHSKAYQNDWKGTFNGSILPNGAYYYLIEFNSKEMKPIKGSLSILGNN